MTNDVPIVEDELQAYVDGRLPEARRAAVDAYLAQHPDVRERVVLEMRQRASLRGQLEGKFAEPVPPRLWIANIQAARRATMMRRLRAVAAGVLIFAVGAGAGWFAADHETVASVSVPPATTGVAQNANAAYRTFVVEVAHPVEVASAQEGHLLQWLSRRLGKPLVAPDLTPFGYKLMGGRLLPGNGIGGGAADVRRRERQAPHALCPRRRGQRDGLPLPARGRCGDLRLDRPRLRLRGDGARPARGADADRRGGLSHLRIGQLVEVMQVPRRPAMISGARRSSAIARATGGARV